MNKLDQTCGPLSGYRVLEMGSTIAGPFCGRLLADFGAEVIKVEPFEGDAVRTMGHHVKDKSLYASSIFRNKSLISVDLRTPEGQEVIRKLIPKIDVIVENFRPGGLEKWGLGYEDLKTINPHLIMARISGFGQTGPYSQRTGYGVIGEALSGLRHITGDPDRPPTRVGVSLTDYITGLYAAFGVVMSLLARTKDGQGQSIDTALYECAFSFMEPHISAFDQLGVIANRTGSRLPGSTPNNLYETNDGHFVHITAMGNSLFKRLAEDCMRQPELVSDPRFYSAIERSKNYMELDGLINQWTSSLSVDAVEEKLNSASVPGIRIFDMADIFQDPHYKDRDAISKVRDEELGAVAMASPVPRLSRTPGEIRHTGKRIGEDTLSVLARVGGFSKEELSSLQANHIIYAHKNLT